VSDELYKFRCDGVHDGIPCGATYTGRPSELAGEGWKREKLKHKRDFFLCADCVKRFGAIWEMRDQLKGAA